MITEALKIIGEVEIIEDHSDGSQIIHNYKNTILRAGKNALVKCLANQIGSVFDVYINALLIGTNGVSGDAPKAVADSRTALFGSTLLSKPVVSSIDSSNVRQITVTSVITNSDGNGSSLSEMALQMKSGDLYSMITFPVISKTSSMQLTINWRITMV